MENKQFRDWYFKWTILKSCYPSMESWERIDIEFKWGVYLLFFNSVDIDLELLYSEALIDPSCENKVGNELRLHCYTLAKNKAFEILLLKELADKGVEASEAAQKVRDMLLNKGNDAELK